MVKTIKDYIKNKYNISFNEVLYVNIAEQKMYHVKENKNVDQKEKKMENMEHPLFEKVIEEFEGEIIR